MDHKQSILTFAPLKRTGSPIILLASVIINILSLFSPMIWIEFFYHRCDKDVPKYIIELWVLMWLCSQIVCLYFLGLSKRWLFFLGLYGLYNILLSASHDLIVNQLINKRTKCEYFVEVRNPIRWLLLTIINIGQGVFCFALIFFVFGNAFCPAIRDSITAIYQSILTFTTLGYGEITPTSSSGKIIVIFELAFFMIFITLKLPVVLSVFRIKLCGYLQSSS